MTQLNPTRSTLGAGDQSFLVGETLYLRGLELGDAKQAMGWRSTPFPVSAAQAEEQLKKEVPDAAERGEVRLIACRRSDGVAVGSALLELSDPPSAHVRLSSAQALGPGGDEVQAEMLAVLLPWLAGERNWPSIHLDSDQDLLAVNQRAAALGMRKAVRLRDSVWRNGRLRDGVVFEYLQPAWLEKLGDRPGIAHERPPVEAPRAPARPRPEGDSQALPANAIIGSDRLALRPTEVEDAEQIARWLRIEPAHEFGLGRYPLSAVEIDEWVKKIGGRSRRSTSSSPLSCGRTAN